MAARRRPSWHRGPATARARSGPPAAAAPQQQENAEHDQENRPEHIALEPPEQSQVVEKVVPADQDQRDSPKPCPSAEPRPWPAAVPAGMLPLRPHVLPLSTPPGAPLVARGSRPWRWREPRI